MDTQNSQPPKTDTPTTQGLDFDKAKEVVLEDLADELFHNLSQYNNTDESDRETMFNLYMEDFDNR